LNREIVVGALQRDWLLDYIVISTWQSFSYFYQSSCNLQNQGPMYVLDKIHENYFGKYGNTTITIVTKTDLIKQLGLGRFICSSMTTYIRKNSQNLFLHACLRYFLKKQYYQVKKANQNFFILYLSSLWNTYFF